MNGNDVAQLNVKASGASEAAAGILSIRQAIHDVNQENKELIISKNKSTAALSSERAELQKYEREMASCNNAIAKAISQNSQFAVRLAELEANGKSGSKTWQTYTDKINQNNQKIAESEARQKELNASMDASKAKIEQLKAEKAGYTQEINANRAALAQNKLELDKLNSSLKITEMSYNQLKSRASFLTSALNSTSKSLDPVAWNKYKKELDGVTSQMDKVSVNGARAQNLFTSLPGPIGRASSSIVMMGGNIGKFLITPFGAVIGILASVGVGFFELVKHSMEFSKAVSELKALTGATGQDLVYLKNKSKELAGEFGKSASEIVESMKMVGSAKPELLDNVHALSDMTKAVLILSKATGMDMTEATDNVTTIMNQFGMSADKSTDVINILAAGSKYGAKEVDYLGESISKVGTVSKTANISLEQTTALMELFGEKGIKAETAGNGFRKVLTVLQADQKNYTNGMFDLNKAIENNQGIANNNIALQKKFGEEFFIIGQVLLQNKKRFEELTQQVTGTNVAMEQYADATDNLSGDVDKMKSSWDAFLLSLEDGQGPIAKTFRSLIQFAKESIDVLQSLTKSAAQKEEDQIATNTKNRIESFKRQMGKMVMNNGTVIKTNPTEDINAEIKASKELQQQDRDRYDQINAEIEQNSRLGGAWAKKNKELEKESSALKSSINNNVSYVNALLGLRQEINKPVDNKKGTNPIDPEAAKKALEALKKRLEAEQKAIQDERKALMEGDKEALADDNVYSERIGKLQSLSDKEVGIIREEVKHKILTEHEGQAEILKIWADKNKDIKSLSSERADILVASLQRELQMSQLIEDEKLAGKRLTAQQEHEITLQRIEADRKAEEDAIRIRMQLEPEKAKQLQQQLDLINQQAKTKTAQENGKYSKDKEQIEYDNKSKTLSNLLAITSKYDKKHLNLQKQQLKQEYDRDIKNAQQTGQDTTSITEKYNSDQEEITRTFQDNKIQLYSAALGAVAGLFAQNTIAYKIAATAQATIDTYVAANAALATVKPTWPLGTIAAGTVILQGLGNVAKINGIGVGRNSSSSSSSSSNNATRVVNNYSGRESGGFMDVTREQDGARFNAAYDPFKRGYVDRPTVIVGEGPAGQSKEWIASNAAISNPTIAPIISIIDSAQRAGNISTIDMNYLMRRQLAGFAGGGSITHTNTTVQVPGGYDHEIKALIAQNSALLQHLKDNGIVAGMYFNEYDKKRAILDKSRARGTLGKSS